MSKIKVAYLDYSHIFAGAERVLCAILNSLDRNKVEPYVIFPYPEPHHKAYNFRQCKIIYLATKKFWWMGGDYWKHPCKGTDFLKRSIFGIKLCSVLIRNQIDILHVNLLRPDSLMWILPTHFSRVKIVGHFRSDEWEWMIPPKVQKCCDKILCVSDYCRDRLLSKGHYVDTSTLYDSFDIEKFRSNKDIYEIRKNNKLPEHAFLISSIGQLSPHKGHDNAIRAFAQIASEYPKVHLFIVGGGSDTELKRLKEIQASFPNISHRVSFTEKQVDNVADIYKASNLVLSLTHYGEAFGLVPYEASIMNIPFIAPDGGAIKEFITDGQNGLLVDTFNTEAIACKIKWVLNHPKEVQIMVRQAHDIVVKKLQPSTMAHNLLEVYKELMRS